MHLPLSISLVTQQYSFTYRADVDMFKMVLKTWSGCAKCQKGYSWSVHVIHNVEAALKIMSAF